MNHETNQIMHTTSLTAMLIAIIGVLLCTTTASAQEADKFRGWEGMRVVLQEDSPGRLRVIENDNEAGQTLAVINTRQARLEMYHWLPPAEREPAEPAQQDDEPNMLPMAPELERTELTLDQLPRDVMAHDVDGDGRNELIVLTGSPMKVLLFERADPEAQNEQNEQNAKRKQNAAAWKQQESWDLLEGAYTNQNHLMLLRRTPQADDNNADGDTDNARQPQLLISCSEGIQQLTLAPDARPQWLEPKAGGRADWWLMDLDGDGDRDLVTWSRRGERAVRWYEASAGRLLPPQVLHDRTADAALALHAAEGADELLLLGGEQTGLLRRYVFGRGKKTPLGDRAALPLPGGEQVPWIGVRIGDRRVLVAADSQRPRLVMHELTEGGWGALESFPVISDVQALAAPQGAPGTLLLWAEDAGHLYRSEWRNGRFTFPKPAPFGAANEAAEGEEAEDGQGAEADAQTQASADRQILALNTVGRTTWWIQRVGAHLDLYVWPADRDAPRRVRFEDIGEKVSKAMWLGDNRLLVLDQYARQPRLVQRADGAVKTSQPAHIKRTSLDQYRLYGVDDQRRPARLSDGVLRWLDDSLNAEDQIMLEGGQDLVGFVPTDDGRAWALQRGGGYAHLLAPDESGIARLQARVELPGGQALTKDPVLGLMLVNTHGVMHLAPGQPAELAIVGSIDGRTGRPSGVKEPTIHRIFATDVLGDGRAELVMSDDKRHQLTALAQRDGELEPIISWPVFEDRKYPYTGFGSNDQITEPRAIAGLDFDGDGHQDLAMLSHDRLIIYLGREENPE